MSEPAAVGGGAGSSGGPAAAHDFSGLADELAGRLTGSPRRIFYLSRNDLEPGRALAARFPGATTVLRTKADFQGKSPAAVLRAVRTEACDLFVFHDRPGEVERLADLYRLVAAVARARRRFIVAADVHRGRPSGSWRIEETHPTSDLPRLALHLAAEGLRTAWLIATTPARLPGGAGGRRTSPLPPPPYRIAYLRTDHAFGLTAGGSISHISGVTGGLLAAGHSVAFYSSDRLADLDTARTPVTVIPPGRSIRLFDEAAMLDYHHRFVDETWRRLRENPPHLLYQRHSLFNAAGAVLARRLGVPLLLEANNSEVVARAMWSRLTLRGLATRMERCAFQGADAIVAVSSIARDSLVEQGAPADRILVNPNGVDPERFHPGIDGGPTRQALGFGPDDIVCGFLGTFTRWHGVLFLAEQAPAVLARHPAARFLFMGDGDLRSAAEQLLAGAGVADRCHFTGLIPHDAVPEHLAACDVLISPHMPFDDGTPFFGSPTKLFEYLAMGRAVVASNLGQIGEVVEDGTSGMLYPPGSAEEFGDRLGRVLGDPDLRRRLGDGARRRVVAEYTWRRNAERALEFLRDSMARRSGSA